jgi:uroporphyrinogen-III decarboxylase
VAPEHGYQFIEGEYMMADEYDLLIQDPSNYFSTVYLPRVFGAMQPLKKLAPVTNVLEMYGTFSATNFIPYGFPDVQEAFKKIFEAANEVLKYMDYVGKFNTQMKTSGFPGFFGGGTKAPFDCIGDTMRGTRAFMFDIYRQPDKVMQAMEALTPLLIKMGASSAKMNGNPIVFIPLHKGADGFLSDKQFRTLYWPTLKKLLLGLIEEGCVPFPWAEGGFNSRLEAITDMPKGTVLWGFDATNMANAKKILGKTQCIGGNMPSDLLNIGTEAQIRDYVKKTIDDCAPGGGYIMINGAAIDEARTENVKNWIDSTRKLGKYR